MKKKHTKTIISCGIFCVCILLAAVWYSVTFNDSRLVAPMELQSYRFQAKDLPMMIAVFLTCVYAAVLFFLQFARSAKENRQAEKAATTRKINPKLGYLGFLGLLGFTGFWTYPASGAVFPFVFFLFFGFFSFFYEGKLSGTFMDERFRENKLKAYAKSDRIILSIVFVALIVLCQGKLLGSLEYTFIAAIIVLSLALAVGFILPQYLLYHYDHADESEE